MINTCICTYVCVVLVEFVTPFDVQMKSENNSHERFNDLGRKTSKMTYSSTQHRDCTVHVSNRLTSLLPLRQHTSFQNQSASFTGP